MRAVSASSPVKVETLIDPNDPAMRHHAAGSKHCHVRRVGSRVVLMR